MQRVGSGAENKGSRLCSRGLRVGPEPVRQEQRFCSTPWGTLAEWYQFCFLGSRSVLFSSFGWNDSICVAASAGLDSLCFLTAVTQEKNVSYNQWICARSSEKNDPAQSLGPGVLLLGLDFADPCLLPHTVSGIQAACSLTRSCPHEPRACHCCFSGLNMSSRHARAHLVPARSQTKGVPCLLTQRSVQFFCFFALPYLCS